MSKHKFGNALRQATSSATLGLVSTAQIAKSPTLNLLATGSINPQGNNTPAPAPTPTPPASRADAALAAPVFRKKKSNRIARGAGQGTVAKKTLGSGLFLG